MQKQTEPTEPQFISKRELSRKLGKTPRTIEGWMRAGYLPYIKLKHTVLFDWSKVQEHLARNYTVRGKELAA